MEGDVVGIRRIADLKTIKKIHVKGQLWKWFKKWKSDNGIGSEYKIIDVCYLDITV